METKLTSTVQCAAAAAAAARSDPAVISAASPMKECASARTRNSDILQRRRRGVDHFAPVTDSWYIVGGRPYGEKEAAALAK